MKEIKVKFNIGDSAWFYCRQEMKPMYFEVGLIIITKNCIRYGFDILGGETTSRFENELFLTKEELLNNLSS